MEKDQSTPNKHESTSVSVRPSTPTPETGEEVDFSRFRLSQNFGEKSGVEKLLTTVPVRKPNRQQYFRVSPEESHVFEVLLLEYGEKKELYLIAPEVQHLVVSDAYPARLVLAVDRAGICFLWPLKLPREEGRQMAWHTSAMEAAEYAKQDWVRMASNMSLGAYEIFRAQGELPEPQWPRESFQQLLAIAFKKTIISSPDHIVLRQLAGEV